MVDFPRLEELVVAANSRSLFDGMMLYFERETTIDLEFAFDLHNLWVHFIDRTNDRKLFISELKGVPPSLMSYNCCQFLHQVPENDFIKLLELRKMIAETYCEVHKKIDFVSINADLQFAAGLGHLWEVLYSRVHEHRLLIAELNLFSGPLALQGAEFLKQLSQTEVLKMLEKRKTIAEVHIQVHKKIDFLTAMRASVVNRSIGTDNPHPSPFRGVMDWCQSQVMAAPVISISLYSSNESVGSSISRVILFGSIPIEVHVVPADLPITPEVGAADVALPVGVLELDTHSSSKSGPSEGSLPLVPVTPMVLPFLCSNDFESTIELPERHVSSAPHDAMVARWRSRVASQPSSPSGSSSPTTSTSEIPTTPILPAPPTIVAPSTDIISPIATPPGGFDRKEDGWTPTFSSLGIETLYGHTSPVTTIADSSTPSRLVYPPPTRTSRGSEAFRR
ncbi:hypothetical protein Tco_1312178 [Tanacetum coccineum]